MPIFEFTCTACNHSFETLVRGAQVPTCPACASTALERRISLPRVKSETTQALAMDAARRRDKAAGHERVQEQIRYEKSHDD
ncbi:MAG: zinc ribbon domain-containing protein [Gemmatimonadaceae bacterium]